MQQLTETRVTARPSDQFLNSPIQHRFVGVTKRAATAIMIVALSVAAPSSVSGQSLAQRLAEIEAAMPGNSYTKLSPALAIQSWEMAATIAHIQKPASCKTAKLTDTKVTAVTEKVVFTSDRQLKQGQWSEIWTFDKCGKTIRVRAGFKADGKGTADGEFALAQ